MYDDYAQRVDAVIQYMHERFADRLTLDELAAQSHFSRYHFSRIFASIVGIPPMAYLNQVRLQKAISYLAKDSRTILDVAQLCGFESISAFNAAFKKHYSMAPGEVKRSLGKQSNIPSIISKKQEAITAPQRYDETGGKIANSFLRRVWDMNVSLKELPAYGVAYARHVGSYLDTYHAWSQIGGWAHEHGLTSMNAHFIGISLDDPVTVDEFACRYDACVTLPENFTKSEDRSGIQFKKLQGGLFATYVFYDTLDKLALAYQSLFGHWLPQSEYEADDRPCLEFSLNFPAHDPEGKCKVELYIPIRKRMAAGRG